MSRIDEVNYSMAEKSKSEMSTNMKGPQSEAGDLFKALGSWRDESQRQFSTIINSHSKSIIKVINNLVGEVSSLQSQLSVITNERNDLLKTVDNLNCEIRHLSEKLLDNDKTPERGDRVQDIVGQGVVRQKIRSEGSEQEESVDCGKIEGHAERHQTNEGLNEENNLIDSIFNESVSPDMNVIELVAEDEEISVDKTAGESVSPHESWKSKNDSKTEHKDTNSESHVCQECSLLFSTSENLEIHINNIHPNLTLTEANPGDLGEKKEKRECSPAPETSVIQDVKKFTCDKCPFKAKWKSALGFHIKVVHEKFRSHICEECGFGAVQKKDLMRHMTSVHNVGDKFKCNLCSYTSVERRHLNHHIERVHEKKTGSHFCKECGYAAFKNNHLKIHLATVHKMGETKFECDKCPYSTPKKGVLKTHLATVHKIGENKFKCEKCPYTAPIKSYLKMHLISVHEKRDKKFKCEKCPYASLFKASLKTHMEGVHENIKNYVCEQCGYAVSQKSTLKRHMETVHKMRDKQLCTVAS